MSKQISWCSGMDEALKKAGAENKCIFVDFFNPDSFGCNQMDTVTYPQTSVIEFIEKNMIALRVPPENRQLCARFKITWSPTLVTLDDEGEEHHRTVGFLPPEELVPCLLLGIAKSHFELEHFNEAVQYLGQLLEGYPRSRAAPEAILTI